MLNSKTEFSPIFFNWHLSYEKIVFVNKSRDEPTIFFIEKISLSLKLFSGHFHGQSFVKTVRGPLVNIYTSSNNPNNSVYTELPDLIFSIMQIGKIAYVFS